MMKRVTLQRLRTIVRRLIENELDDELNTVKVGDVVDVDSDEIGTVPVRVVRLVADVNAEAGPEDPRRPGHYSGPGFEGVIEDPEGGESGGNMIFSLNQVVPGSKAKGFFPKLGAKDVWDDRFFSDEDEYGRDALNPYRKMAKDISKNARLHRVIALKVEE